MFYIVTSLLKSGLWLAPIVKPNNFIPPNVLTSTSPYMSHNIIRAIFSCPCQSDTLSNTNKENMCLPHEPIISSVCQEQAGTGTKSTILCACQWDRLQPADCEESLQTQFVKFHVCCLHLNRSEESYFSNLSKHTGSKYPTPTPTTTRAHTHFQRSKIDTVYIKTPLTDNTLNKVFYLFKNTTNNYN